MSEPSASIGSTAGQFVGNAGAEVGVAIGTFLKTLWGGVLSTVPGSEGYYENELAQMSTALYENAIKNKFEPKIGLNGTKNLLVDLSDPNEPKAWIIKRTNGTGLWEGTFTHGPIDVRAIRAFEAGKSFFGTDFELVRVTDMTEVSKNPLPANLNPLDKNDSFRLFDQRNDPIYGLDKAGRKEEIKQNKDGEAVVLDRATFYSMYQEAAGNAQITYDKYKQDLEAQRKKDAAAEAAQAKRNADVKNAQMTFFTDFAQDYNNLSDAEKAVFNASYNDDLATKKYEEVLAKFGEATGINVGAFKEQHGDYATYYAFWKFLERSGYNEKTGLYSGLLQEDQLNKIVETTPEIKHFLPERAVKKEATNEEILMGGGAGSVAAAGAEAGGPSPTAEPRTPEEQTNFDILQTLRDQTPIAKIGLGIAAMVGPTIISWVLKLATGLFGKDNGLTKAVDMLDKSFISSGIGMGAAKAIGWTLVSDGAGAMIKNLLGDDPVNKAGSSPVIDTAAGAIGFVKEKFDDGTVKDAAQGVKATAIKVVDTGKELFGAGR